MKTDKHFWSYLALFFLEWQNISDIILEKIKTHSIPNNFFFLIVSFMW